MFGIGFTEIVIIGLILIVAVGPDKMPGLLKAVLRGYREFRKATRDLRASTGIDEILQDEDLKSLRNPLYVPPKAKAAAAAAPKPGAKMRELSESERADEVPSEGVDLAEVRHAEREPAPEAIERRNAKIAVGAREAEIVAAKNAVAEKRAAMGPDAPETDEERALAEKIAAFEEERIAAKVAAHRPEDEEEYARRVKEKMAAAGIEEDGEGDLPLKPLETEEEQRVREGKLAAAEREDEEAAEARREAKRLDAGREAKQLAVGAPKPSNKHKPLETEEERARREAKLAALGEEERER